MGDPMDMVSKPGKRAIADECTSGKVQPSTRASGGRGRAPTRVGACSGLVAAKTKLKAMTDNFGAQADRDKAHRLQFPPMRSNRSQSHAGRSGYKSCDRGTVEEPKDRSPVREAVTVSDTSDEDDSIARLMMEKASSLYLKPTTDAAVAATSGPLTTGDALTAEESGAVESACNAARKVLAEAAKSNNLNGVVRGNINSACREILEAMDYLQNRTESEEIRRLKADNKRMREQLAHLSGETKALRTAFAERSAAASQSAPSQPAQLPEGFHEALAEHSRELFVSLGNMLNVRLEAMEKRLPAEPILRPPLAADRTNKTPNDQQGPRKDKAGSPNQAEPSQPAQTTTAGTQKAQQRVKAKVHLKAVEKIGQREEPRPTPIASQPPAATPPTWTEVVSRKSKAKANKQAEKTMTTAAKAKKPLAPKALSVPKSSAVVITMKPETDMSYLSALQKVTTSLKLSEVGIESVRVRKSATGARLIEVPGASSGRIADDLAERIKGLIGDVATVHRPVKTADLRITGFDESVMSEDVRTAVVLKGGCSADHVKVSSVRMLASGTGSVLVRCPVTVANILIKEGRVLVGWSSAHVKALDTQPMRCYKCMGIGHTRALCPSPVDRSDLCHRCSRPGHKAASCEAEPYCVVCSAAKRPAKHVMGGMACSPPPSKSRPEPAGRPAIQRATEEIEMDV